MAGFVDIQYCIFADIVGVSEKVQNYADVIHGWPLYSSEKFPKIKICKTKISEAAFLLTHISN